MKVSNSSMGAVNWRSLLILYPLIIVIGGYDAHRTMHVSSGYIVVDFVCAVLLWQPLYTISMNWRLSWRAIILKTINVVFFIPTNWLWWFIVMSVNHSENPAGIATVATVGALSISTAAILGKHNGLQVTIERYDALCRCDTGGIYIMPVLQGYSAREYLDHLDRYGDRLRPRISRCDCTALPPYHSRPSLDGCSRASRTLPDGLP
jgi:hypothetical protein